MAAAPDHAAICIDVEQIDDHRQQAFEVQAGVERRWIDESEGDASDDACGRSPSWPQDDRRVA